MFQQHACSFFCAIVILGNVGCHRESPREMLEWHVELVRQDNIERDVYGEITRLEYDVLESKSVVNPYAGFISYTRKKNGIEFSRRLILLFRDGAWQLESAESKADHVDLDAAMNQFFEKLEAVHQASGRPPQDVPHLSEAQWQNDNARGLHHLRTTLGMEGYGIERMRYVRKQGKKSVTKQQ